MTRCGGSVAARTRPFSLRTGGVYGGVQDVSVIGMNWYPNDDLRLMLDYGFINVDRLNAAGATQVGQRIQAVALRAQAAF